MSAWVKLSVLQFSPQRIRQWASSAIILSLLLLQFHALSHLKHDALTAAHAESLKSSCAICDVRNHTPSLSAAAYNFAPEIIKFISYSFSTPTVSFRALHLELYLGRGPPLSPV